MAAVQKQLPQELCNQHCGMEVRVEVLENTDVELKKVNEDQWTAINTLKEKVSDRPKTTTLVSLLGAGIVILGTILGTMWVKVDRTSDTIIEIKSGLEYTGILPTHKKGGK